MSANDNNGGSTPEIPRSQNWGLRSSSNASSVSSDLDKMESSGNSPGKIPLKSTPRLRRLRRSDRGRSNHLQTLVSERKASQQYLSRLVRRDSIRGSLNGSDDGPPCSAPLVGRTREEVLVPFSPAIKKARKGLINGLRQKVETSFSLAPEKPSMVGRSVSAPVNVSKPVAPGVDLTEAQKEQMKKMSQPMKDIRKKLAEYEQFTQSVPVEVRLDNLSYTVPIRESSGSIKTVYNSSIVYKIVKFFKNLENQPSAKERFEPTRKVILDRVSLALKPGRMYLLLGPPSSGKSTLLKAVAGRLANKHGEETSGDVTYNGRSFHDKTNFHIENAIAFIDQLDKHAPRLTVDETFEFAFQCKIGGCHDHLTENYVDKERRQAINEAVERADDERLLVNLGLKWLGLTHVRDTFVGDDDIRGVSGGQRRRVTVGEMMLGVTPLLLGDEISNGLDASSTFEMIQWLTLGSKDNSRTRVISLLQPSPETVALFDEIILMAEGKILYAGPTNQAEDYFAKLGYQAPPYMDVADFLQILCTPADCEALFEAPPDIADTQTKPYSPSELAELFRSSVYGERIQERLRAPHRHVWGSAPEGIELTANADHLDDSRFHRKYVNSFPRSTLLNLKRNLVLWIRDRRVLIANAIKNLIMGVSVGGVFFQTDDIVSILGVLFQGMLFIMLGAMTTAPSFIDERVIYYKLADANFFSSYPFVLGKAISKLPQTTMDCIAFGTILYFMVGLANTAANYFIFMAIIIAFSVLMNELLFVIATFARTKDMVAVASACLVFFFILFSGFIIPPNVIPDYYTWIYWYNPMAWAYRALMINEYRSPVYTEEEGDAILVFTGFVDTNGDPYSKHWVGFTFIYLISHTLFTIILSGAILRHVRVSNISGVTDDEVKAIATEENQTSDGPSNANISFKPVTLTFEDICYDVKSSTSNDTLRLLHDVNGAFRSGRMCALMGSSGAGKTTLMDVIAMRKTTGTVSGDIRLNGFPQDPVAFRRCSGYVEQFDVQTQQLTVRETVLFSARLRLDAMKVEKDEEKQAFVDNVLTTLELKPLADVLVGNIAEGGLTFEQKKRLSIAVELAASPSILFLDEPTTGLDARSALLVVKLLRKIADQGRTICATIHQPSSAVFDMFDDLLLLAKGGKVVYYGELGYQSKDLINYFEKCGAKCIEIGDNPANWMLREMQSEKNPRDLAEIYLESPLYVKLKERLADVRESQIAELEIAFPTRFAAPVDLRQKLMNKRLQTIYWRSPAYNLSRLLVCSTIAFILGSVFLSDRNPTVLSEADMRASLSVIFLSFIIIGILSITSVLPVMLSIRDVFYRHRNAGMLDNVALGWALGTAEKWFIVIASFLFCLVYIGVAGMSSGLLTRAIRFWGIFTFNLAMYSYFGQAFMCLVPSMTTAQILASVFIGLNNFFSGLIVRPQFMTGFFQLTYWITPGHYVYESLVLALYHEDRRKVIAEKNSDFYEYLQCAGEKDIVQCAGTAEQFIEAFFGGRFSKEHELQNILVLAMLLVIARVMTFFALKKFNFSNTQ